MRKGLLFIFLWMGALGCSKDKMGGKDVEIYLLDSRALAVGACKVNESSARLSSPPAIRSEDIESYSASEYQFTLTASGYAAVKDLGDMIPFAVAVDGDVIYYGIIKSSFSSSSCDASITMNTFNPGIIQINLGYPGTVAGVVIEDKRNDARLLATLRALGKLVP